MDGERLAQDRSRLSTFHLERHRASHDRLDGATVDVSGGQSVSESPTYFGEVGGGVNLAFSLYGE